MAGGAGTRLWPLSRRDRPKQVLNLFGSVSLLRMSFERLRALLPPDRILVIGAEGHRQACLGALPELPPGNYLGEPCMRDTAAAVAFSAAVIHHRDPDAIMGVFTADHVIKPVERFAAAVDRGFHAAESHPDALVTFGIRPAYPHTGYGYVQRGPRIDDGVYRAARFTEKPDLQTADRFVAGGEHYWNSGMFVWRAETILAALREFLPDTHRAACTIAADVSQTAGLYPSLQKISIDFAVMEKHANVLLCEMAVEWADVGSWRALRGVLGADADGNVLAARHVAALDSRGCTFVSEGDHLIAALGVDDLVIVHSPDVTLVCRQSEAERIKALLAQVQDRFGDRFA